MFHRQSHRFFTKARLLVLESWARTGTGGRRIYCATRIAEDAAEADKNYLIFRCGNDDDDDDDDDDDVDVRREGQVDPPLIGCDRRLTEPSLDYRVVKYSESAAAPISW